MGRLLPSEDELEWAAEQAMRERELPRKTPWWKRMFSGRGRR